VESEHYNFTALNIPPITRPRDMPGHVLICLSTDPACARTPQPVRSAHPDTRPPAVRIVALPGRSSGAMSVDCHQHIARCSIHVEVLAI